jgi:hypothetical protein
MDYSIINTITPTRKIDLAEFKNILKVRVEALTSSIAEGQKASTRGV